jgi:cell division protein FtsI (penicillin-binding protein 3)
VAAGLLAAWVVGIEARLVYLQVVARADLVERAERQYSRPVTAPAKRGDIVDRNGRVLATSLDADSVTAVPSEIDDKPGVVAKVCKALGDCTARERQQMLERLSQRRAFAYLRRQVSPEAARRVAELKLEGVGFLKESRRFYPKRELASHVLGYVGIDNNGLGGLEHAYDKEIRGKDGSVRMYTDARRQVFSRIERPPTAGASVELTIDEYLQHVVERELRNGIAASRAAGGTAIVMDPRTGEILAMASAPTFNPNSYREADEAARRNRAVQDLYEPGSTFKIVTASAAVEERLMPIDAWIDTSPGIIRVAKNHVVDEYRGHNYGVLSFTDVIVKSSNVGAIKIGFRLGTNRLSDYVQRFGFGRPISPDFPGENPGIVWRPEQWTDSALASVSMGYQVGVTALQMVAAASAVANGGELVEPRVVRAVYRDGRRLAVRPKVLRRVVSRDTAAVLTTIMEGVVERGTAELAQIAGYTIAGKTGTASKLVNGRYSAWENNVSFVGFLPSQKPAVSIIVMVDTPRAGGTSGGVVSAPIFRKIAEAAIRYLGVPPTISPEPPVLVAKHQGEDDGRVSVGSDAATITLVNDVPAGQLPDLRSKSGREATRLLVKLGVRASLTGDGFVVSQDPPPGTPLDDVSVCRLVLQRSLPRTVGGPAEP